MHPFKSSRLPKLSWRILARLKSLPEGTQAWDNVYSLLSVRKVLASDAFLRNFPSHIQSSFTNTRLSKSPTISSRDYFNSTKTFYLARKGSIPSQTRTSRSRKQLQTDWGLWTTARHTSLIWASFMVYLAYKNMFSGEEERSEAAKNTPIGTEEKGDVVSRKGAQWGPEDRLKGLHWLAEMGFPRWW